MARKFILLTTIFTIMATPVWAETTTNGLNPEFDVDAVAMAPTFPTASSDKIKAEYSKLTTPVKTVGSRRFQVETGIAYGSEKAAGSTVRQLTFPTQVRYGVLANLEVNVAGDMFTYQNTTAAGSSRGFGDITLGSKWDIVNGGGLVPTLGLAADLSLPIGSNNVSDNSLVPAAKALMEWGLPWSINLESNLGVDIAPETSGSRFARLLYGVAIERPIPIWNNQLSAFVEFAGAASLSSSKAGLHIFGTGVGATIRNNIHLSTFVRLGINSASPNVESGLGFSWKI